MNILKCILIFTLLIIFIFYCKKKEDYKEFRELKDIRSLSHATIDELIYVGLGKKRSKDFMKRIKATLLDKLPPNSVKPGENCVKNMHELCIGDSKCFFNKIEESPVCSAGIDGTNPVGLLPAVNRYGNYDNGSTNYFPLGITGCVNNTIKCPPRYKCDNITNTCDQMEPIPIPTINIPKVDSTRLMFQPPFPIESKEECPPEHTYLERKYSGFCKHNITNNECALEPNKRDGAPFCSTVTCPDDYYQIEPGFCETDDRKQCSLEPTENYPLCGGHNDYLEIENIDIKGNSISKRTGITEKECATSCQQNVRCDGFVMDRDKCDLKKNVTSPKDIFPKEGKKLYLKTPINYTYHENTDLRGDSLKKYINKTYIDCAKECDNNNDCIAFTVGKDTDFSTCELKKTISGQSYFNNKKRTFKKKYRNGTLCESPKLDNIDNEIKDNIQTINKIYNTRINNTLDKLKKESINTLKMTKSQVQNNFIQYMINNNDIITWDSININCNKIIIEKLDNLYLHMSILQIWGSFNGDNTVQDFIQDNKTTIKMSSIFEDHNSKLCRDNNLHTFMSTNYNINDTQYIEISLPENINVHKIIIFNKEGKNKDKLVPFKISLYNDNYLEHFAVKENFTTPFQQNKYFKLDKSFNVKDKGNLDNFYTIANIDGIGDTNYCRFTKDNTKTLLCSGLKSEYQHVFKNMETPYTNTYFKYQNVDTLKDDICRCTGLPNKSKITCRNTENNEDYLLKEFPNCDSFSGKNIKNQLTNTNSMCKSAIDFKVDAGFYWSKTLSYYLFRNTTINNKKVVLYTVIDSDSYIIKKGYPKILNKITWRGLTFTNKIDSVFVLNNDIIIFTRNNFYVKYNLKTNKQEPGYPKKIKLHFQQLPDIFTKKITAGINIGNNIGLLFNGRQFVEYDLNLIENTVGYTSKTTNIIRFNLTKLFTGIKFQKWDAIVSNYRNFILFFIGDVYYLFDIKQNKVLTKTSMRNQWKNIWKINVNNL